MSPKEIFTQLSLKVFNFKIALACFKFIVCLSNIKRFESWSQSPKQFSSMLKISPRSQKSQEYIWRTKFPDHQLSCSTCNRDKMSPCKKKSYSWIPSFHLILSCTFPKSQDNKKVYPFKFFSNIFARVDGVWAVKDSK